jgi:transcription elongation GreA/GreB family factor
VSRAFVKESDREPALAMSRAERDHPYYMTPAGFRHLQERLAQAKADGNEREVLELEARLDDAQVVDPAQQNGETVTFGARVTIEMPDKSHQTYQIVGEDEADPLHGTISWLSPLAQALMERSAGARALWQRPAGNVNVRIVTVEYG